jgi:1-acyl-sn-glycerol-3-phosphate acyltransferase
MTRVRAYLYVAYFYLAMLLTGVVYLVPTLIDQRNARQAPLFFSRLAIWGLRTIVGARVRLEGMENIPHGPALVASKHQSMLDAFAPFLALSAPVFVLKQELLKMPIFGYFAARSGMIPIDRDGGANALKRMLRAARTALKDGRQIVIFPEGTRQLVGAAPEYKPGVAALYRDLGLPCVPVASTTGLVWAANGFDRWPGVATLRFLPAIPPGLARDDFMRELEARIEAATNDLVAAVRA